MKEKVLVCWSGGKDSASALSDLLADPERYEVVGLLTTVTEAYGRISMHGVRRELLHAQAQRVDLPLQEIALSVAASNDEYESKMKAAMLDWKAKGVHHVAFGDIFLEDLRAYREANLAKVDMKALFPLWKRDTSEMVHQFIAAGFRTVVTCLDPKLLDRSFAGRTIDAAFLTDLPDAVDPCGENGEFHTFVYDAPIFSHPITITIGEVVDRDGFTFCDLLAGTNI